MNPGSNFLDVLILLGALQGGISSFLLFRAQQNPAANRRLAWLLLLLSLACLNIYLLEMDWEGASSIWLILQAVVPLIIIMPVGPLIYFYTRALTTPEYEFRRSDRKHFYPILLDFVPYLAALTYVLGVLVGLIDPTQRHNWGNFIDRYNQYVDIPRWISITVYLWFTYRHIRSRSQANQQVKWAKRLVSGFSVFQIIWLLHLVPYILPDTSDLLLSSVSWYPIYVPLMVLIYWLGINGFILGQIPIPKSSPTKTVKEPELRATLQTLKEAMLQDQLFLNPKLGLEDVIAHTGIPQKTISHVLNQHLGKNFNQFVNEYRIEAVKDKLTDPEFEHLTITGIALESGFNSQATFQRTFKSLTGKSPGAFRQAALKKTTK